jgi:N-acetylneuraminic acid mutarotase
MKIKISIITIIHLMLFKISIGQGVWTQKTNLPTLARTGAVSLVINGKGYVGMGLNSDGNMFKDFWEYEPLTDTWTQKADFPGGRRIGATGFSIGTKGYVGTGNDTIYADYVYTRDFWEYDQVLDTWTQKANYPGALVMNAISFAIGNKGYLGTGQTGFVSFSNELYEYDASLDVWTQKASLPAIGRTDAAAFTIGNNAYVGTGFANASPYLKDFWMYNPALNSWVQKPDFEGLDRYASFGFAINGRGYIGTGVPGLNDVWEYDTLTSIWTQVANFGGGSRASAVGFSINNKGYVGTGLVVSNFTSDFWEFFPSPLNVENNDLKSSFLIYPNPFTSKTTIKFNTEQNDVTIKIRDILGKEIKSINFTGRQLLIEKENINAGIYFIHTIDENKKTTTKKIIIQ